MTNLGLNKMTRNIVLLLIVSLYSWHCDQNQIIATVGNYTISENEIRKELSITYSHKTDYKDLDIKDKSEVLERIIIRKLKLLAAYDLQLDKDPILNSKMADELERLMLSRYHERFVIDKVVSEEELSHRIARLEFEVHAAHILIGFEGGENKTPRSITEAQSLANQVTGEARKGIDFSVLAEKYSDDPAVSQNMGDLSYITPGSTTESFEKAAWNMEPGEISDPVETVFGFHVIKVLDKRRRQDFVKPDDRQSILKIKEQIYSKVKNEGAKIWNDRREALLQKYNFKLHKSSLLNIKSLITEKLKKGRINIDDFSTQDRKTVLSSWDGGELTLGDMLTRNDPRARQVVSAYNQLNILKKDVESESVIKLFLQDAYNLGINEETFVKEELKKFLEQNLIRLVEVEEVLKKVTVKDDDALIYYKNHQEEFKKDAEIEIWEIYVTDKPKAEDLVLQIKDGVNFSELAKKYSKDDGSAKKGGYLGFKAPGSRGAITEEAFMMGAHQIAGPVEFRDGWSIVKTGKLREESIRPYIEVKNQAKSLARREQHKEYRGKWEQILWKKHGVTINKELLMKI
jgi:parvulin-like peptidyl-prolyl isomerase